MGYDALWIPSDGSNPSGHKARVLFMNPSNDEELQNVKYSSLDFEIEYEKGFFPLLKELVDDKSIERIQVKGQTFTVRKVRAKADGDTLCATLKLST
jgi:hypothetical protein